MDKNYQAMGATVIFRHLQRFCGEIDGVLENRDIECIHRMRVASRRLRCCLRIFRRLLPKDRRKIWASEIAQVAKTLGRARDLDVQIQTIGKFYTTADHSHRPAMRQLQDRLKRRRTTMQADVKKALAKLTRLRIVAEIEGAIKQLRPSRTGNGKLASSIAVKRHAAKTIAKRLQDVKLYEKQIRNPRKVDELHRLRVAARKLRYSLEIFEPAIGHDAKEIIRELSHVQDALGAIHDCDVWTTLLPTFINDRRKKTQASFGEGMRYLRRQMISRRAERFESFLATWRQMAIRNKIKRMLACAGDRN